MVGQRETDQNKNREQQMKLNNRLQKYMDRPHSKNGSSEDPRKIYEVKFD